MEQIFTDYQKISFRGTLVDKAEFHRRKYRHQSFSTFKVLVNDRGGNSITIPVIAYGQSATTAAMKFRAELRIMVVGEFDLDPVGKLIVRSKFFRYGRLVDEP